VATNLLGPFLLCKAALPALRKSDAGRGGQIVNIASTASLRAWPNASAYHASKWGLLGLSRALHAELRAAGIRVSTVVAGGMRTPFLLERFPDLDPAKLQDPANVAEAVHFLLSMARGSVVAEIMVLPEEETSWP
jgi:NAD(P)-dependent dehydrogenase (short-subunit alcohol dehydrogenase family)